METEYYNLIAGSLMQRDKDHFEKTVKTELDLKAYSLRDAEVKRFFRVDLGCTSPRVQQASVRSPQHIYASPKSSVNQDTNSLEAYNSLFTNDHQPSKKASQVDKSFLNAV
jgi:hypothetical protein